MTMAEIDQRRTDLGELRKQVDAAEASSLAPLDKAHLDSLRYLEACAEVNVLVALHEWWAQGCREPGPAFTVRAGTCACTTFDDGSRFELAGFAGGGAPGGEFSTVTCIRHTKDADTVIRYVRVSPSISLLLSDLDKVIDAIQKADAHTGILSMPLTADLIRRVKEYVRGIRVDLGAGRG